MNRAISVYILGSGRAGRAVERSLASLALLHPELGLQPARFLKRDASLTSVEDAKDSILAVTNPAGLHADAVLQAEAAGFRAVLCEKPSCVSLAQLKKLQAVRIPAAIFHVYRQTWGAQTLKVMIDRGDLGKIITIEGRYWQASTAERALQPATAPSWKNDPRLSGESDALLDVGVHWIDFAGFLFGSAPRQIRGWKSFANAEAAHRESHVQAAMDFGTGGRAWASISKTMHGATNHFEVNVIGEKSSATWNFLNPDEIHIGAGRDRRVLTRKDAALGSRQPPFHGLGWIEGYIEISYQLLREVFLGEPGNYPRLADNLAMMESIFNAQWTEQR